MTQFRIVIPARFESTRLPGKVLLDLVGKPMIQHVWERASASGAGEVIIGTDNERVADVARGFGAQVCMTSADCESGTDRVAEVCRQLGWGNDLPVVNVQGDAPLIPPASIRTVANLLAEYPDAQMATLCVPCANANDYEDSNVVKVVFSRDGRALYFSRAPIPSHGHSQTGDGGSLGHRHLGLYGYRVNALLELSATEPCALELTERLEQLRALWLGMDIRIAVDPDALAPDVDTPEDVAKVEALLRGAAS